MFCPCGREIKETSVSIYSIATYNEKQEIIYAVCSHGVVIIDKLRESNNDKQ